jgi:hypothetical protein
MDGANSTHGKDDKCVHMKGRDYSEEIGVDGWIILEWILEQLGGEHVDWKHMAQDRDQWRVLANTEMNLRFS